MDLSKYLKFANEEEAHLSLVTKSSPIQDYLCELKEARLGPSGQAGKLMAIMHAETFLICRTPEGATREEMSNVSAATITRSKVQSWKAALSKEKGMIAAKKKEYISQNMPASAQLREFLNSQELKDKAQKVSADADPSFEDKLFLRRYV